VTLANKYRYIALSLSIIFAVFNIGLPIVVASCPMMKYADSNKCIMCSDGSTSSSSRLTNWFDKSCCETKYAAERNTTEFLQETKVPSILNAVIDLQTPLFLMANLFASANPQYVDTSPPSSRDIPIFISSLLI
jgi:hypothetical protein